MTKPENREEMKLIETMLWTGDTGFYLLDLHIERLEASAKYFGFICDRKYILSELKRLESGFRTVHKFKVRLLLSKDGTVVLSSESIRARKHSSIPKITMSTDRVDSGDMLLFHKTTFRNLYDSTLEHFMRKGFYDAVFMNEKDELTEGAWNNILLKIAGVMYTPPVSCGLLNGVYRRFLVGKGKVRERILYREDIENATSIYCCNSVRGYVSVKYISE